MDEEEAIEGVKSGAYYAAIVIPEDFSDSLLSILSGDVKKPQLDYYINEKKNAIAPKITDTGATTLQQQINDTFCPGSGSNFRDGQYICRKPDSGCGQYQFGIAQSLFLLCGRIWPVIRMCWIISGKQ